jgi:uncharacterized YccA/Bax inhibitor family protein
MRSANPVLTNDVFRIEVAGQRADVMTLQGTVIKTGILLALVVGAAAVSWLRVVAEPGTAYGFLVGAGLGGLVAALATVFKPTWAPYSSPVYAVLEGLSLGALSKIVDMLYPGIVPQAVCLTFGTLAALLVAYSARLIRATENFKLGIVAATGGICLVYLATFLLGLFHVRVPYIHESGLIGIGFSLFVVVIAALNLVLDFDFIERGAEQGAAKHLEWYGAFGLMVTLVWLYVEILHLLMKLQRRD